MLLLLATTRSDLFILHVLGHLVRIQETWNCQLMAAFLFLGLLKLLFAFLQIQIGIIIASHFLLREKREKILLERIKKAFNGLEKLLKAHCEL